MSMPAKPIDPESLDDAISPADDFYRHVNARWLAANPVPAEYPAWGAFREIHERNEEALHAILERSATDPGPAGSASQHVGDYFTAGMDTDALEAVGVAPLQPYLARISGLESLEQLPDLVRDLQLIDVTAFYSCGVIPDFEDPERYLVALGQGGLGLPEPGYYARDDERSVHIRDAYVRHITAQLSNLGIDAEAAIAQARSILELETALAASSWTPEQARDLDRTINRHALTQLDELMPTFGLTAHLRSYGIEPAELNVDNPGFFRTLEAELASRPLDVIGAYLRWHLVRAYASSLTAAFEDEAFDFYSRTLSGQQQPQERWKRILAAASEDIGEQVAQLYVAEHFSHEAKERCAYMVEALFAAMGRAIRELDWMTDTTKEAALEKLAAFAYKVGYPDTWRDYTGLEIDGSSFAGNRMRAATFEVRRQLDRLDEPVDRGEWGMPAHAVNAYYHPLLNEIVFPAGILQAPMFYPDADEAVNFGGIGAVIGHEITHGFDDQGRRYDPSGKVRDWWSAEDATEFGRLADLHAAQFDAYTVLDDQHVNGRLTAGENIADLGGVAIAYSALLDTLGSERPLIDGFTPEQRFFLAYASIWRMNYTDAYLSMLIKVDPHSPHPFRVNGPLSNFPPFAAAFGIEEGAPMARPAEDRVRIW